MSTSSASICDLFGSCLSSAPNCVSISRSCCRCRSRLIDCFFLPTYSSFSFTSFCWPSSSSSSCPWLMAKKPATGMPTRISSSTTIFGAECQVPGSFQLVRWNSSASALRFIAMSALLRRVFRRRRLGGVLCGGGTLELYVHVELRDPLLVGGGRRLHLNQQRLVEPGRSFDVAHQRGDARVGLRVADDVHLLRSLAHRLQVNPLGHLAHHLLEQVHRLRAVGLQRFDDLLAREQRLDLVAQLVDLGDVLVELLDLGGEERVAVVLRRDLPLVVLVHEEGERDADDRGAARDGGKVLARALAALFAVRQQVDAGVHCGSNLLMARPQATISDGASTIRRLSWMRGEACIRANGLATLVGT